MSHIWNLVILFFLYAFAGWCAEVLVTAVQRRQFVNRGAMLGPVVPLYGLMAAGVQMFLEPSRNSLPALLVGSVVLCAAVELLAGALLEHVFHTRWWDYSSRRFQLKGYICLEVSLAKGVAIGLGAKYLSPLVLWLLDKLPGLVSMIAALVLLALLAVDALALAVGLGQLRRRWKLYGAIADRLQKTSGTLSTRLAGRVLDWQRRHQQKHLLLAFPKLEKAAAPEAGEKPFAAGLGIYKLFWIFFIGSLVGDAIETVFVWATSGVLMSRSSLLYGPFSVVWGLGAVLLTLTLHGLRDKSDRYIFLGGLLMGGVYEYMCSVFTERAFGKVFWDYSKIPFNINGRINLLYCVFWGVLALVWVKEIYPRLEKLIQRIPPRIGRPLTWVLAALLAVDAVLTCLALFRLAQREMGVPATSALQQLLDSWYPNDYLYHRYQNML